MTGEINVAQSHHRFYHTEQLPDGSQIGHELARRGKGYDPKYLIDQTGLVVTEIPPSSQPHALLIEDLRAGRMTLVNFLANESEEWLYYNQKSQDNEEAAIRQRAEAAIQKVREQSAVVFRHE